MNGTDLRTCEHRKKDFGDARQVDGDTVALVDTEGLENVRHLSDSAVEREVREGAGFFPVLGLPQQCQLVLTWTIEVAVNRIGDDVGLSADEPLEEGCLTVV